MTDALKLYQSLIRGYEKAFVQKNGQVTQQEVSKVKIIKAVYEHVLHFWSIIFNTGGYVVQRHVFSEGVYSQSSHNVT